MLIAVTLSELVEDIPRLLAYAICLACLIQLFVIFFVLRKDILKGLKGKDGLWQFIELSALAWLVIFPCVVIVSLLGQEVESGLWASLDTIYFANLGAKGYYKKLELQHGNKKENSNNNNDSTNSTMLPPDNE